MSASLWGLEKEPRVSLDRLQRGLKFMLCVLLLSALISLHHSCWDFPTVQLHSWGEIKAAEQFVKYHATKSWSAKVRRKEVIPFYTAFKLVLRSLNREEVNSCTGRDDSSPLLVELCFEPRSSSFAEVRFVCYCRKEQ